MVSMNQLSPRVVLVLVGLFFTIAAVFDMNGNVSTVVDGFQIASSTMISPRRHHRHCSSSATTRSNVHVCTKVYLSSTGSTGDDDDTSSSVPTDGKQQQSTKPPVKCPDCDLCDGSGRISGGIGAVLDWWPIKAYRPCPNFIERGGTYSRSGQPLDEIAFGRDSKFKK